jgi:chromosome segregation ATPase
LNRLIDQQGNLLDEVSKVDAKQFEEWRRVKQVELERLLQQKQHVQQEFQRLRQSHDEAVHKLREHELRSRQYHKATVEAGTLRTELATMKQQLQQAQARAFAAEQLAEASQAADGSYDAASGSATSGASPRVKELAAELAEADADRQRLRRQLEQIQDNLKRTLTEKEFIEDRFMQLDADRQEANAPTLAAAPEPAAEDATMVVLPA